MPTVPMGPEDVAAVPERSLAQRMEALQRANDVRTYRARMKAQMKAGAQSAIEVLREPPVEVATMKVFDLVKAQPKVGRVKTNKILGECKIAPSKTVGGLSERQRRELAAVVRRRGVL